MHKGAQQLTEGGAGQQSGWQVYLTVPSSSPGRTLLLVAPAAEAHALLHALRQGAGAAALLARVRVAAHAGVARAGVGTAHADAGADASAGAHGVHHASLAGLVVPANALQMTDTRIS
jgi:hypothetical protein